MFTPIRSLALLSLSAFAAPAGASPEPVLLQGGNRNAWTRTRPVLLQGENRNAWEQNVESEPGPSSPDRFHPDRDSNPTPRRGGRVIVHLSSKPKNMNYMLENSASTRRMLREVHETLLERDWEEWDLRPVLAKEWIVEDAIILKGGRGEGLHENIVFGKVEEDGDNYKVTPLSPGHPLSAPKTVAKSDVESVERESVHTFAIKEGVKWHDGKTFDAHDAFFSYYINLNDTVDNKQNRYKWEKFQGAELIDDMTIRFFYEKQYFLAAAAFEDLTMLPSHVFNMADPECPEYQEKYDGEWVVPGVRADREQGEFVNNHGANNMWVGLGPYRVIEFNEQWIDAERFDGYFDPQNGGYVDRIRWRHINSDDAAKQAILNGELDYWERLKPEDYFGGYTKQPAFVDKYYKGYVVYPAFGYTVWNCRREKFSDPEVRRALGHCYDWSEYIQTVEYGLGSRVSGTPFYFSPTYNHEVDLVPFDLDEAEEILLEAGWYDRDGDDIIDKDGVPFEIEFLMPTGNKISEKFGQILQENLGKVGIKMTIASREWAQFLESLYDRDFDAANLAWILDVPESDPEQIWHSKWADAPRSSNHSGFKDEEVDRLIKAIQQELDDEKRAAMFREMQARIYELQPYLFGTTKPKKIAMAKRVRNFRSYAPDPGYRIRDWFILEGNEAKEASAPR